MITWIKKNSHPHAQFSLPDVGVRIVRGWSDASASDCYLLQKVQVDSIFGWYWVIYGETEDKNKANRWAEHYGIEI